MTYEMYLKMKQGFVPEGMEPEEAAAKVKAFEANAPQHFEAAEATEATEATEG